MGEEAGAGVRVAEQRHALRPEEQRLERGDGEAHRRHLAAVGGEPRRVELRPGGDARRRDLHAVKPGGREAGEQFGAAVVREGEVGEREPHGTLPRARAAAT